MRPHLAQLAQLLIDLAKPVLRDGGNLEAGGFSPATAGP
jgi:hypothetical protein